MKHTQGPWKWHGARHDDGRNNGSVYRDDCGTAYCVAKAPQYAKDAQWEADAKLIAAAPEMLDALKKVQCVQHLFGPNKHLTAIIAVVDSAVSKAEGKERDER
jgi:hypothetical protein